MQNKKLKWKSDFEKSVIIENFVNRGWTKSQDKEEDSSDWNVYWATVWNVRNIFNPKSGFRLNDQQIINHFPNHYELTRKDCMVKNLKRFKREQDKETYEQQGWNFDFLPTTYVFPGEYSLFVEEFHRCPNQTWIVKPAARSQGKGIFLLRKIQQLKKIAGTTVTSNMTQLNLASKENYVVSKYIDNPLLIGGKKFDLRMYVLVTNYKPLKVWIYNKGFGRFCNEQYTTDVAEIENMFVHLTNVAIQQYSDKYSQKHGGKYSIDALKFYVESAYGTEAFQKMMDDIHNIMLTSLKSVQAVIQNDKHCFEMYGYDILLDANLKPWLIEINASPSLTTTTPVDKNLKLNLINDVYNIVLPNDDFPDNEQKQQQITKVGGFSVLYDESLDLMNRKAQKRQSVKIWK
ncbi:unnamed protein product [Paramecium octaurelia]|uniref:ATP-grasp domain-containing protein n=1 Tax=Paramecium octaurelia TaxID=43137 RepID=A0A8S1XH28_PAROT|nr:unnamed protein product [Paramecium octaurelia]